MIKKKDAKESSRKLFRNVSKSSLLTGRVWPDALPIVDWAPVEALVRELEASFGHLAFFCYDRYSPRKIGVKFRPSEDGLGVSVSARGIQVAER